VLRIQSASFRIYVKETVTSLGLDAYEAQYRERKVTTMAKQAKALGDTLVPLAAQG